MRKYRHSAAISLLQEAINVETKIIEDGEGYRSEDAKRKRFERVLSYQDSLNVLRKSLCR